MRAFFPVVACSLVVLACSGEKLNVYCPTGTVTGTSPHCILSAQCKSTNTGIQVDCSGTDGNCTCIEDGVPGAIVPFQDAFCKVSEGSSVPNEDALEAANDACGWKF